MDIVFWILVIVLIVGFVWWLLNRSNSTAKGSAERRGAEGALSGGSAAASAEAAGTAGLPGAAGFGAPAEPTPPPTADDGEERSGAAGQLKPVAPEPAGATESAVAPEPAGQGSASHAVRAAEPLDLGKTPHPAESAVAEPAAAEEPAAAPEPSRAEETVAREGGTPGSTDRRAEDEWETQWSETGGSAHSARHGLADGAGAGTLGAGTAAASTAAAPLAEAAPARESAPESTQGAHLIHHPEYTDPHAPTLPGAETAAADDLAGDVSGRPAGDKLATGGRESAQVSDAPQAASASSASYERASEPMGHLAAEQPYGAGSASPGPDGSGPADYAVKGDAGSMVYYEEGHPDYERTTAGVWFESAAHAEAAGFRAPRRTRL